MGSWNVISQELLKLLVCPDDRTALTPADPAVIAAANRRIAEGSLRNRVGRVIERQFDAGLIRADGQLLYAIVDDLPIMLIDEAVPMDQLAK